LSSLNKMVERKYSLGEVRDIIDIRKIGENYLNFNLKEKITKSEYNKLATNIKDMEKYPEIFIILKDSLLNIKKNLENSVVPDNDEPPF